MRVEFVRRLAETLPGNLRTGRGPSHEEIGLAAGLNRGEVQNILATGGEERRHAHAEEGAAALEERAHLDSVEQKHPLFVDQRAAARSTLGLAAESPSFSELVEKALPGKLPKTVLKELRRRGLVQLLPDEIVRYRKTTALPTELSAPALAYAAEQMRLLGNTLLQSMRDPADSKPRELAYVASEPIKVPSDVLEISQPAILARIASFIQGIEIEFGRSRGKSRKSKGPSEDDWRKRLYVAQEVGS